MLRTRPQQIFYTSMCTMNTHKNNSVHRQRRSQLHFISLTCFILKDHPQADETLVGDPQSYKCKYTTSTTYTDVLNSIKKTCIHVESTAKILNIQYVRTGHQCNIIRSICTSKNYMPGHKLRKTD